jgi:hypothetical protein
MHTSATPAAGTGGLVNPNPAAGIILVQLSNNFNRYLSGFNGFVSPVSGTPLTSVTQHNPYTIVSLGTATLAQWQAKGFPVGFVPAVGASFIATATGTIGGSAAVEAPSASGIVSLEVVGDPNQTSQNSNLYQNGGMQLVLQALAPTLSGSTYQTPMIPTNPVDGSVVGLNFYLSNSSVSVNGQ